MSRSTTPPSSFYPLTPPSTGSSHKRSSFGNTKHLNANLKRLSKPEEEELATKFFSEVREDSDIELATFSEGEFTYWTDNTTPSSPVLDLSIASAISTEDECDHIASITIIVNTVATSEPFPLLKLPLSVRKKVYEHLLVIPALISVRQNRTSLYQGKKSYLHAESRELLPGIASALAQLTVNGYKVRFSRFANTNINILLASKEVHAEAKAVLYGKNVFEIPRPSTEMIPPTDFSVRLFPSGSQRLVTKLIIRIRSFYDLTWLLDCGYNSIKNFYRGINTLTLLLELDSSRKGFGKHWSRREREGRQVYIERLHSEVAREIFGASKSKTGKVIPTCINLCVLFGGESYDEKLNSANTVVGKTAEQTEQTERDKLRSALIETWELFKKSRH